MNWWRRKQMEEQLEKELRFHLEQHTNDLIAQGHHPEEARRQARLWLGGPEQVKQECRDARGTRWLEDLLQDVRYAWRGLRRSPMFVFTVVTTIALGLGLNTALFSIFNATYFRPIAVRDPHSLYQFFLTDRSGESHDHTWTEYQELSAHNPVFSEALGYRHTQARVDGHTVLGTLVTEEYFRVLGVGVALGRTLLPTDTAVIVLSYRAWQNRFSGDPDIVGRKVLLRGYPFEVVGVARAGFAGLGSRPSEFWAPWTQAAQFETEHLQSLLIVGRLKPEFSVRQAQAGLTLWAQRFTAASPNEAKAVQAILVSRATTKPLNVKGALVFSPIAVAFLLVLLIACGNVANMMLARAASRQREIGIRLSLGAARGRVIRLLLTESLLLALPSTVVGVAVSQAAISVCVRVLLATLPLGVSDIATRLPQLPVDLRVSGFTLVAALLSAVLFGLVPALQATRVNVMQAAKGDFSNEFRPSRLRNALVIGQVTVCVLLLVTASILLRGVDRIRSLDADLSKRNTIEIGVREKFREKVLSRLFSEPAVDVIAAAGNAPVDRKPMVAVRTVEGGAILNTAANNVSPEYFAIFEIRVVRGRNFTVEESRSEAPVAIISQTTAQRLWPNQEAVGLSLNVVPDQSAESSIPRYQVVRVIGIARDEIRRWIGNGEDRSLVYVPSNPRVVGNQLFFSARGDFEAARRKIETDLTAVDPDAVAEMRKIQIQEWVAEDAYYTARVAYWLSSAVGILALLLTLSGIYAVISYVITQRTKEIGIRMALGATTGAVTGLMLKQSIRLAIVGALAGSVLAMGMSKALASVLVMINTFDAAAYIGGSALVLAACAAAAYFPSRRAALIDPLTTWRYD